jgi:ATP-dependent 26S proteasome regulatory subunit
MQDLIERLQQYKYDYDQGELELSYQMVCDCKIAAEAIQSLQSSKHTQKRARQRLSAKNREYRKLIQQLQDKIHNQKAEIKYYKQQREQITTKGLWKQLMTNVINTNAWKDLIVVLEKHNIPYITQYKSREEPQAMEYPDKVYMDKHIQISELVILDYV